MTQRERFAALFGRPDEVHAHAPGRVNLIGEHTDYNDGFVLPVAVPQRTVIRIAARSDVTVRAWSANVPGEEQAVTFDLGSERVCGSWIDYVQGVTVALSRAGLGIRGVDMLVASTVPLGAGLASSASLEVAIVRALSRRFRLGLDEVAVATIAHAAETEFVGVPVGLMDQMAASLATAEAALFLDTRTLAFERIPLPASLELLVVDSGITHAHTGNEYRDRRRECVEAARLLGVSSLRDATEGQLDAAALPPPLNRRARHVVTENRRVSEMARALFADDAGTAGALMNASHASMRDDFEISTPEIDELAAIARAADGVAGARLTGGGFGGCVVALVERGRARSAGATIAQRYIERTGRDARVLVPEP